VRFGNPRRFTARVDVNGANRHKDIKDPVIVVRKGSKITYCSEVSFEGKCQIVYRPGNTKHCSGATVWIEVDATTELFMKSEKIVT
jgi:hypothetical protein